MENEVQSETATESEGEGLSPLERAVRRIQRPTWELELLITAGVVFSLFQLPGLLQRAFARIDPHLSQGIDLLPFLLYYLGTLVVIALIIGFLSHFLLRSLWVAWCGLNSVFPDDVDWDKVDMGPVTKKVYRENWLSARELEQRTDRIASTIFSILFSALITLILGFFYVLGAMVVLWLLRGIFWPGADLVDFFLPVMVVLFLPMLIAAQADLFFKRKPERLDRFPRLARFVEGAMRIYNRLLLARLYAPITITFTTRFSQRATGVAAGVVMLLIVTVFLISFLVMSGRVGFDSYIYFPRFEEGQRLGSEHYENLRAQDSTSFVPMIQSDIVEDPFVRLFIPFRVTLDNARMAEVCPDLEPLRGEGLFRRRSRDREDSQPTEGRILSCMNQLYEVELNGRRLNAIEYSLHRHPSLGAEGLLAYLSTESMPRGRNQLAVWRTSASDAADDSDRESRERKHYLPFWR